MEGSKVEVLLKDMRAHFQTLDEGLESLKDEMDSRYDQIKRNPDPFADLRKLLRTVKDLDKK
jgi:hypothetical protein